MRIGILTIHTAFNYGAMLQAYATQTVLIQLGHEVQIIDCYPKKIEQSNLMQKMPTNLKLLAKYLYARFNPNIQKKIKRFNAFRNRLQLSQRYYDRKELYLNPPDFDLYLVGSDQVWNMEHGFNSFYFLDFVNSKKKISYASSFGTSSIPPQYQNELKNQLNNFSAISIREDDGVRIINEACGLNATQVIDPTFLLNSSYWKSISSARQIAGDYILCYGFDNSENSIKMVNSIRKRLNLPIIALSISIAIPYKADRFLHEVGPEEFLSLIQHAKFVCTSSYHGMAFAINFRKSFFATRHPSRNSRMESMLKAFGLEKRQLFNPEDILAMPDNELFIDYSQYEYNIEKNINESFSWLKSALS